MKKTIFALAVLLTTAFCVQTTVYAEDDIPLLSEEVLAEEAPASDAPPLPGAGTNDFPFRPNLSIPPTGELSSECGADGNMTFYLYVSEENKSQITRIVFYNKNTGDEYFYKFNPVNYDDDKLWVQHINIPRGDYFVSCRVSGDNYGRYSCSLYPKGELHIGDKLKSVICLVGTQDWIKNAYAGMEKVETETCTTPVPNVTPELSEAEATPTPEPTEGPLEEIEYIPQEEPQEEPKEKSNIPFYVFIGVLVVATVFLNTKKKKKK